MFLPQNSPPKPGFGDVGEGTSLFPWFFCPKFFLDLPKTQQEERPIRQILYLGELLETCHFQSFWVSSRPKIGREGSPKPEEGS